MYSILTVQPDGARKGKRKIKGAPKKAETNVRHLEYREVLEEGSERRAAFAQLRSRAHEIAVETVEKKLLSPFNDKVYGLDAHNLRPLGHWRNLEQLRHPAVRVARDHEAAGVPLVRGQGQLRREAFRLHQRLIVDHDELALVRPAVPLQVVVLLALVVVGLSEGLEDAAQPAHDGGPHVLVGLLVGDEVNGNGWGRALSALPYGL